MTTSELYELAEKLEDELMRASHWRISCPLGTDVEGTFDWKGAEDESEIVEWAVDRFSEAGLDLPAAEVRFSLDPTRCDGHKAVVAEPVIGAAAASTSSGIW